MKRTPSINKATFRKHGRLIKFTPVAFAVLSAFALSGCGEKKEDLTIYSTVEDCINNNPSFKEACVASYKAAEVEAIETAPKYATLADCNAEFGADGCQPVPQDSEARTGGGMFMPLMTGYMFGRLLSGSQFAHKPLHTPNQTGGARKFYDASGRQYGNAQSGSRVAVSKTELRPALRTTGTIKRGGFGQMVASQHAAVAQKQNRTSNNRSSGRGMSFGG